MKPNSPVLILQGAFILAAALLACALALAACSNPANGGNPETPRDAQYTITFDSGMKVQPVTGDEGSKIDKPEDPVLKGYTFLGWYTELEGGELFTAWPHTVTCDLTLYAQWHNNRAAPIAEYTITFDSAGGTEVSNIKVFEGSLIGKPWDPEKEGYTFLGWFGEAEGGEAYTWPMVLIGNLTLYAQWKAEGTAAPKQYTITFDSQGGSELSAVSGSAGTLIEEPAEPSLEGYIFLGWYSEAEGGELYDWPHTLTGDITMYAQWSGIIYTVEYNANGGTGNIEPTTHIYDYENLLAENGFTWSERYRFEGWNTQADGGGVNYSAGQSIINLRNENLAKVTLYAKWIRGGYIDLAFTPEDEAGKGWTFANNVYTILNDADVTITGKTGERRIVVEGGAKALVTLENAAINVTATPLDISGATVTLKLSGENALVVNRNNTMHAAGILVPYGSSLTITSAAGDGSEQGSLTATGNGVAAGIGGSEGNANGGRQNDSISAGAITVKGGTVTARATYNAGSAGIGNATNQQRGGAAEITISGGKVTAIGDGNAAGIGGGWKGANGVRVKITGGKVTAAGGNTGAGIGSGWNDAPPIEITITGGEVTATGGGNAAGIGGGENKHGGAISISGGVVNAKGGAGGGAGIGGGRNGGNKNLSVINISGGVVTAEGGPGDSDDYGGGAGIGGGHWQDGGTINISGGFVTAIAPSGGVGKPAAIGGGRWQPSGIITISGGVVVAAAGSGGSISAGENTGNNYASIGDGTTNTPLITLKGGAIIATGGLGKSYSAGTYNNGYALSPIIISGSNGNVPIILAGDINYAPASNGTEGRLSGADVDVSYKDKTITLKSNLSIPSGAKLTVPSGWTLKADGGFTLTVKKGGVLETQGTINGSVIRE